MALEKLIKERIDRLESVPDNLLTVIDKENEAAFKAVLKKLQALQTKDGKIIPSKKNLALVQTVMDDLKKLLFNGDYLEAVKEFAKEISTQAQLNNKILETTLGTFTNEALFGAVVEASQHNALKLLASDAVAGNLIQPLQEMLNTSVVTSTPFEKMVEQLQDQMTGENAKYRKYAGQVVHTAFTMSDRMYSNLIAEKHGLEFAKYQGGHIQDTRAFCNERYGKTFHRKEYEQWGDGINTDKSKFEYPKYLYTTNKGVKIYWEGMDYSTSSATIFAVMGGYGPCRHLPIWIPTEYVSEADKSRAASLGFYHE